MAEKPNRDLKRRLARLGRRGGFAEAERPRREDDGLGDAERDEVAVRAAEANRGGAFRSPLPNQPWPW